MKKDIKQYEDIINKPRPISKTHLPMSKANRAAQFAPFAALTGHKERIAETERLTVQKKELDVNQQNILNHTLNIIINKIKEHPSVSITYFIKDSKKDGGRYVTVKDNVKKIEEHTQTLFLLNGMKISIQDIYLIEIEKKTL